MKKEEDFFTRVFALVRKIPKGRVTTYGAIANFLGTGLSARTVGWAMNSSHASIPAHRVVNRNGLLTGKHHFATPTLMQELLEAEGVVIIEDQIKNFNKIFWDPANEMRGGNKKKSSLPSKPSKKKERR
jgi:methylated-DNA-protein-cysteine methyltransferase-like protein